jgi:AraC-like DNA-binding protein
MREYLRKSFTESPSIAQLASRVGMNRTKLMHGFHTLFGETIKQHVTRLQMEYAVKMLKEGTSCRDIASALGYRHQSSFTTAFRTYFGRAPKQTPFGLAMNINRCARP